MLIKIKNCRDVLSSEITPESVYRSRRSFLQGTGVLASGGLTTTSLISASFLTGTSISAQKVNAQSAAQGDALIARAPQDLNLAAKPAFLVEKVALRRPVPDSGPFTTTESLTPFSDVTSYNNFYEFGMDKSDPSTRARDFKVDPWMVKVSGETNKPGDYALEDLLAPVDLEERIYRHRCVEAWSMVIPWIGVSLGEVLKRLEPTGDARYVEFLTLEAPDIMPGQRSRFSTIDWPYREGLRMDEAMHPLAMLAVGLYDDVLPAQNGAPLRLVVPWKYGFKGIKSIVSIRFTKSMPNNTWRDLQPSEYGFYANVNPTVSHPRWSQARERRLPSPLFAARTIPTLPFNGYADEVDGLYAGMDLRKNY
jgi:sulfoxide reductase catalytic subunit YedY